MKIKQIFFVVVLTFVLNSCANVKKEYKDADEASAEQIYNTGMKYMEKEYFESAVNEFTELERVHPFSKWAVKAKIMAAYANYSDEKYDDAVDILDQYIKLHPGNKDIEYAYYLKALCYYDQVGSLKKDQGNALKAKNIFKEIMARFPESEYAKDARLKIDVVNERLAGKQVDIGKFYLTQGKYIGAINRFKAVVDKYQETTHIKEALYRLVEAYVSMGVLDEAKKYASVLGHNYPDSRWYKYSYKLVGSSE